MATKKSNPAMEFIVAELNKDRKATYADIKAKADAKKLAVYPIMYGRAQTMLGIVKAAKRGEGKVAKARAQRAAKTGKRGPGRPRSAGASANGLDGILEAVKSSERERAAMRAALEKIQAVIDGVLQ